MRRFEKASDVIVLEFSAFSSARGLYIAKALSRARLSASLLTTRSVYIKRGVLKQDGIIRYLSTRCSQKLYSRLIGRLMYYVLFTLEATLRLLKYRPAVVYARNVFAALAAVAYKVLAPSTRVVLEISDLWPEAIAYLDAPPIFKSMLVKIGQLVNSGVYKHVDSLVAHNGVLASFIERRARRRVRVLLGAVDLSKFRVMSVEEAEKGSGIVKRGFTILYAGLLGPFQNPLVIVEAARRLRGSGVVFMVVGTGPYRRVMERVAREEGLDLVLVDPQPHDRMPYIYNLADVCLMTYAETRFLSMGLPKKVVEYSACGKPILCVSPPCVASLLCEEWGAGIRVDPSDVEGFVKVILKLKCDERLRTRMGLNARRMAEALFSPRRILEVVVKSVKRE